MLIIGSKFIIERESLQEEDVAIFLYIRVNFGVFTRYSIFLSCYCRFFPIFCISCVCYNEIMQENLLTWYDWAARALPWRKTHDPYAIWISEIMLQQTRAETVIGYWQRFLLLFPTVEALAAADEEAVLKAWEGLGYYSRALNLHRCAKQVAEMGGAFPRTAELLSKLPGIGDYTAGAVASIAFGQRVPAVDGNVERVTARIAGIREDVGIPSVKRALRAQAAAWVPPDRPGDFNQAMMELGARVCQPAPKCAECPVSAFCDAFAAGDADSLPVKQRKAPQRVERWTVALVVAGNKVLLRRRDEKLLHGMWCFPMINGPVLPFQVENKLSEIGIITRHVEGIGSARHVFTHIIWEMALQRFDVEKPSHCPPGYCWADLEQIDALPIPTAMRAAKQAAVAILAKQK